MGMIPEELLPTAVRASMAGDYLNIEDQ